MFWVFVIIISLILIIFGLGISLALGAFGAYMAYIGATDIGITSEFFKLLFGALGFFIGIRLAPILRDMLFGDM
jgi:hypothetical protein